MTTPYEYSALCKDSFVLLKGACRIEYMGGDAWQLEDDEDEHPIVHRLRAASFASLTQEPETDNEDELQQLLKNERYANENMRAFLNRLDDLLAEAGKPREVAGDEVLTWLSQRLGTES